jgi:hypothetical protein
MVHNHRDAVNSFFDRVKAISCKTVKQAWVYYSLHLREQIQVLLNGIKDSPDRRERGHSSKNRFAIIVVGVIFDEPDVLISKMFANLN